MMPKRKAAIPDRRLAASLLRAVKKTGMPKTPKKAVKKKSMEAVSAEEVKAMDDDEMADLVERYELDVELDKHKTPRRKASAIITALEEKELLADD